MNSTRSTTGCFTCKIKRKKCDETKPHCLRCQKSRIKCPGYTYVHKPGRPGSKPRTLPAPRTVVDQYRATAYEGIPLAGTEEPTLPVGDLPLSYDQATTGASYSVAGSSVVGKARTSSRATSISNGWGFPSFHGLLQHPSNDFSASNGPVVNTINYHPTQALQGSSLTTSLTSGQASLLAALFSLGQPPDLDPPHQRPQLSTNSAPDISVSTVYNWPPPDTVGQGNATTREDENPRDVVNIMYPQLALDKTTESNALPFLLQSYATWIRRLALEPQKVTSITRDFVFSHFGDGDQSRWIIGLLGNIGGRMGRLEGPEGAHNSMLSALHNAVQRRLRAVKTHSNPERAALVKALDCAVETIVMHFHLSPFSEAMALRQEAASIFRQLCHEPPGAPIDLHLLRILRHPLSCVRRYAHIDVIFSVTMDTPTLVRYETDNLNVLPSSSYPSIQGDGIIQWLYGIPDQLILLLAKMKSMRQDGFTPNESTVASLERDIRELRPYDGSSSERFLAIMRYVLQECWKQAAYVYLYMCVEIQATPHASRKR
ncbi:unnamed protein product [Rhizoctonia solani]|uniref:Zn(2)-C6 fungal-type domain-containing protein n=1 Tax=Rhizoctonia solani TaxID=456999 RepID=A0A8H3HML8_9AGAM|nr:unnamed protein product [Rhizoctonia solani]